MRFSSTPPRNLPNYIIFHVIQQTAEALATKQRRIRRCSCSSDDAVVLLKKYVININGDKQRGAAGKSGTERYHERERG